MRCRRAADFTAALGVLMVEEPVVAFMLVEAVAAAAPAAVAECTGNPVKNSRQVGLEMAKFGHDFPPFS